MICFLVLIFIYIYVWFICLINISCYCLISWKNRDIIECIIRVLNSMEVN